MIQWICKKYDFYHVRLWKVLSVYNIVSFFLGCVQGVSKLCLNSVHDAKNIGYNDYYY